MALRYKGPPKKREVRLNKDGDLEVLAKNGDAVMLYGTATITSGGIQVTDARIKSTSFALVSPKHNGPTAVNWSVGTGVLTISGSGAGLVAYQVII